MRLRIATLNGCQTCKAARLAADSVDEAEAIGIDGYEGSDAYSPAEKAAVAFAERLALDHHNIDDRDMAALREHFDDAQILELMMMAGQYIGFGRMLAVLSLETTACRCPGADMAEDLCFLTALELADRIRSRDVSPTEVAEAMLERIARVDREHERVRRPRPRAGPSGRARLTDAVGRGRTSAPCTASRTRSRS